MHCEECAAVFIPQQPVYLARRYDDDWTLCTDCAGDTANYSIPHSCEGCGRLVHYGVDRQLGVRRNGTLFTVCSNRCQWTLANRRRSRILQIERHCDRCGDPFVPTRSDARFCSDRCRVAAHRRKQSLERR